MEDELNFAGRKLSSCNVAEKTGGIIGLVKPSYIDFSDNLLGILSQLFRSWDNLFRRFLSSRTTTLVNHS